MEDKYLQIAHKIESELRRMRAEGITRLPTEESFCEEYSCSRQTIRAALNVLVDKGLIVKKRGSGSYIADDTTGLNNTVVFITGDRFECANPEFISQLKIQLKKNKYDLICYSTEFSFTKEKEILVKVINDSPAAVIIEPYANIIPNPNISLIEEMDKKGIPVVYLYSSYPVPRESVCIEEDDVNGAIKLISHLKDRGHKKTCCIFRCDDARGLARYKAYIESCRELRMGIDEHNAFFFTERDRRKMIKGDDGMLKAILDEMDQNCTAVICHNDEVAYRLIRVMENRGISVPEDLAVVSFENSYSSSSRADITSLGHSDKELVAATVNAVTAAAEHKKIRPEKIGWKLHVRNSG